MSIVVTCRSCGKTAQAPDAAAGKTARCLGCGNPVPIPAPSSSTPAKRCTSCGIDLSGQKRTKDTAGRYYCQPCWAAKLAVGVATTPSRPAGDLQTLDECADCGLCVPADELVAGDNGRMICPVCFRGEVDLAPEPLPLPVPAYASQVVASQPVPMPVLPYRTPPPVQKQRRASGSGGNHAGQMLVGGAICAVGIVVTAGTYLAATAGGGGRYTIAWGAIVFGGFRFFRGLAGMLSDR